jgi:hypothetical protein
MKIAIAFFGLPRCSKITFPSIEKNILSKLPKNSAHKCFYHLYVQEKVVSTHSNENGLLDKSNYEPFTTYEGILERPEEVISEIKLDEFKKFGNAWNKGADFTNLKNLLLQLRSLKKVTSLVERYEPDCVLFIRPDLFYHDPIEEKYFDLCMKHTKSVTLPEWQWGCGVNDRFALLGKNAYKVYGNRLDEAFNYCNNFKEPLHSERLLKYALIKNKIAIFILDIKASRVRINGEFVKEKFQTNISLLSPLTNPRKRFLFFTKIKTKIINFFQNQLIQI